MTQFYLPTPTWPAPGLTVRLDGDEAKHARDAYRLTAGDEIRIFDGKGKASVGTISEAAKSGLEIRIDRALDPDPVFPVQLDLGQALMPNQTMDDVMRQATELGVSRVWPIACERSIVKLDAAKRLAKLEHWRKTSLAACKQCDRNTLPEIMPVIGADDLVGRFNEFGAVLTACPQKPEGELGLWISDKPLDPARILLLIGPEGDFSPDEIARFSANGSRIVSLGPLILKSDTAAASAISVLQYLIRSI
ncbi:MAG: 16S rRNA (uracil(1498)-N(3))-methyltransferase [Candidatus Omnitrophica bacterium]|jgi:16S rRNA (uracil1498-N3)-methyltransferase|nr:16S rRNA (uracil(1498)-N(3))-methyltransferase [Candidatus Omnitrophota bacterium]